VESWTFAACGEESITKTSCVPRVIVAQLGRNAVFENAVKNAE
jgi:hypothetical protein